MTKPSFPNSENQNEITSLDINLESKSSKIDQKSSRHTTAFIHACESLLVGSETSL